MIAAGTTLIGTNAERVGLVTPTRGGWTFYESDTGEIYRAAEDGSAWSAYHNLPDTHFITFTGADGANHIRFPNALANALDFSASTYGYLRFDTVVQRRIDFNYTQDDIDFYVYYSGGVGIFCNAIGGHVEFGGLTVTVLGNLGVGAGPPVRLVDIRGVSSPIVAITNTDAAAIGRYCDIQFHVDVSQYASIRGGVDTGAVNRGFVSIHTRDGASFNEQVRVDYLGRVGIGTTTPRYALEVVDGTFPGVAITSSPLNNYFPLLQRDGTSGGLIITAVATAGGANTLTVNHKAGAAAAVVKMRVTKTGTAIGHGTPDRECHVEVEDGIVSAVTYPLRISHAISAGSTAANGIGVGIEFELENDNGIMDIAGTVEVEYSDASDGSEDADLILMLMEAGAAAAERGRLRSDGVFYTTTGIRVGYSTANVSNPPTDAEVDGIWGSPAIVGNGFVGVINDNGADTDIWIVVAAGAVWAAELLTVLV